MAKFYVESGNFQLTVHAKNARGAAIWAVHRAMGQMMPFLTDDHLPARPAASAVLLGELIRTSEQGFGRTDGAMHDTFDVMSEWHRLLVALDKLQDNVAMETTAV